LNKEFGDGKKEKSLVIDRNRHDKIAQYLKEQVKKPEANFKHFVKSKGFNLMIIDDKETLHKRHFDKKGNIDTNLPMAVKEDFFEISYSLHSVQRSHCGINKIQEQVKLRFYGISTINSICFY
jgi:hypothetical protein